MKRTKKPDARPPPRLGSIPSPFTFREPYDWVTDPRAPVYPSESKSINHAAFKKTVEMPKENETVNRLKDITASLVIMRGDLNRIAEILRHDRPRVIAPPRRAWWSRTLRLLFMPWAAE